MSGARVSRSTSSRFVFAAIVSAITWIGFEFPADGLPNLWYAPRFFGVPGQYLALTGLMVLLSPYMAGTAPVSLPHRLRILGLWRWTAVAWVALVFTLVWAIVSAAPELFADWRNFVVLAVVVAAATRYLASQPWRDLVLVDLAIGYGLFALIPLAGWVAGGGFELFGVRTPLFYGPALYLAAFSAIVLVEMWSSGTAWAGRAYGVLLRAGAASSLLLVLLSFRRTYWLLLGLGFGVIAVRRLRDRAMGAPRVAALGAMGALALIATFSLLGTDVVMERLESFLPGADTRFAATNEDHIGDIADAFDVVMENPITGLGIGTFYQTKRIENWKDQSFEVHNTLLHVWLKFGLLGLIAYLGFHLRWIASMVRPHLDPGPGRQALIAGGIYLACELVATTFATWPYGSFQQTIHHAVLLAALLAVTSRNPLRDGRPAEAGIPLRART